MRNNRRGRPGNGRNNSPLPPLDLNCDLGEGEALAKTRRLMAWITSANIACGGHAGSLRSMSNAVAIAGDCGVRLGAHPGFPDPASFGRKAMPISPSELALLLMHQVGALVAVAAACERTLHHVKLHGALYHVVEDSPGLARAYVETIARHWPGLRLYVRSGGRVARQACVHGIEAWEEIFGDRGYRADGCLVARTDAQSLITDPAVATQRLERWIQTGQMETVDHQPVRLSGQTICIHSDSPNAARMARSVRQLLARPTN